MLPTNHDRGLVFPGAGGGVAAGLAVFLSSEVSGRSWQFLQRNDSVLNDAALVARKLPKWVVVYRGTEATIQGLKVWEQQEMLADLSLLIEKTLGVRVPKRVLSLCVQFIAPLPFCAENAESVITAVRIVGPTTAVVSGFYETSYSFIREIGQEEIGIKKLGLKILQGSLRGCVLGLSVGAYRAQEQSKNARYFVGAAIGSIVGAIGAAVGTLSAVAFRKLGKAAGCQDKDFKIMSAGALAGVFVAGPILGASMPVAIGSGVVAASVFSHVT